MLDITVYVLESAQAEQVCSQTMSENSTSDTYVITNVSWDRYLNSSVYKVGEDGLA